MTINQPTSEPDPPLPRQPQDRAEIRRLRQEAMQNLDSEERPLAVTVYGGPPAGAADAPAPPPAPQVTRRWTLRRIVLLIFAVLAGLSAALFGMKRYAKSIFGGLREQDNRGRGTQPVYGGPVPPPPQPPLQSPTPPAPKPHRPVHPAPAQPVIPLPSWNSKVPSGVYGGPTPPHPAPPTPHPTPWPIRPAPVYGGPPPRPVLPPQPTPPAPQPPPQDLK